MTTARKTLTLTLEEYGPTRLWYAPVTGGDAGGVCLEIDTEPSLDPGYPEPWYGLKGTIGDRGEWRWDGENEPCDSNGTTIINMVAYR
jgi:hypothetical protein